MAERDWGLLSPYRGLGLAQGSWGRYLRGQPFSTSDTFFGEEDNVILRYEILVFVSVKILDEAVVL